MTQVWRFESKNAEAYKWTERLHLVPVLNLDACVADVADRSPGGQFNHWADRVRLHAPDQWEADAVAIEWWVHGERQEFKQAPFQAWHDTTPAHFLGWYTWPVHPETGAALDWFTLPVRYDRWPGLTEALGGWLPSPLQRTMPLRSMAACRHMAGR